MAESTGKSPVLLTTCFYIHDALSGFLARNLTRVKMLILVVAHASLLGFLLPEARKEFGEMARNLLLFILFLSPLSKIFGMRLLTLLMSLRRQLGIWFAYLATVHGLGYVVDPAWSSVFSIESFEDAIALGWPLIFGIIAYVLTLPLLFTSNNISLRLLKAHWKRVQMLVYLVLIFGLLHGFLVGALQPGDRVIGIMQTIIVLGAYILLKALAGRNFLPPLERSILYVSQKYDAYQAGNRVAVKADV